jgi:hypothetical protein
MVVPLTRIFCDRVGKILVKNRFGAVSEPDHAVPPDGHLKYDKIVCSKVKGINVLSVGNYF